MKYGTFIDTVALQLDFTNAEEQRRKLSLLCQWVTIRELGILKQRENSTSYIIKYDVMFGGSILFTIHSGFTTRRNKFTGEVIEQYYIRIRFAGLKSHKQKQDDASINALMTVCAFLNTTRTKLRLVELDIAIDIDCKFDNILALCLNKASKTTYNEVGNKQFYKEVPTSYIEKYRNKQEANNAVLRSYLYDKSAKEALLGSSITRFELKLQNRFFIRYGFSEKSILDAMNRYYVMYFDSVHRQVQYCNVLNNFKITPREIEIFGIDKYRLSADKIIIKEFIKKVLSVYVDFNWNIVVPIENNN